MILSKGKKNDYSRKEMVKTMYLSQFIKELQESLEKHGDAPVIKRVYYGGGIWEDGSPDYAFVEADEEDKEDCDYDYYYFS